MNLKDIFLLYAVRADGTGEYEAALEPHLETLVLQLHTEGVMESAGKKGGPSKRALLWLVTVFLR